MKLGDKVIENTDFLKPEIVLKIYKQLAFTLKHNINEKKMNNDLQVNPQTQDGEGEIS